MAGLCLTQRPDGRPWSAMELLALRSPEKKGKKRDEREIPAVFNSNLLQHVLGAGDRKRAGLFNIELFDNAAIDNHRITLAALAHAELGRVEFEAKRTRKVTVAVGEHANFSAR